MGLDERIANLLSRGDIDTEDKSPPDDISASLDFVQYGSMTNVFEVIKRNTAKKRHESCNTSHIIQEGEKQQEDEGHCHKRVKNHHVNAKERMQEEKQLEDKKEQEKAADVDMDAIFDIAERCKAEMERKAPLNMKSAVFSKSKSVDTSNSSSVNHIVDTAFITDALKQWRTSMLNSNSLWIISDNGHANHTCANDECSIVNPVITVFQYDYNGKQTFHSHMDNHCSFKLPDGSYVPHYHCARNMVKRIENLYICESTGNHHLCGRGICDAQVVVTVEGGVCRISGLVQTEADAVSDVRLSDNGGSSVADWTEKSLDDTSSGSIGSAKPRSLGGSIGTRQGGYGGKYRLPALPSSKTKTSLAPQRKQKSYSVAKQRVTTGTIPSVSKLNPSENVCEEKAFVFCLDERGKYTKTPLVNHGKDPFDAIRSLLVRLKVSNHECVAMKDYFMKMASCIKTILFSERRNAIDEKKREDVERVKIEHMKELRKSIERKSSQPKLLPLLIEKFKSDISKLYTRPKIMFDETSKHNLVNYYATVCMENYVNITKVICTPDRKISERGGQKGKTKSSINLHPKEFATATLFMMSRGLKTPANDPLLLDLHSQEYQQYKMDRAFFEEFMPGGSSDPIAYYNPEDMIEVFPCDRFLAVHLPQSNTLSEYDINKRIFTDCKKIISTVITQAIISGDSSPNTIKLNTIAFERIVDADVSITETFQSMYATKFSS